MRTSLAARLRSAGVAALDLLLPPQCLTCDAPVLQPGRFCADCFAITRFVTAPHCARCGTPFATAEQGGPDSLCPDCRADPPAYDRARGALRYDAQARKIVLALKHADRVENAAALAPLMLRAGITFVREADLLVPVPLHRGRLISRRYNQAALLARALARLAGKPARLDALERIRTTRMLGDLGAAERQRELHAAIVVRSTRRDEINGRRILLIDDVLTSGATASSCARALLDAGATAVDVLVAARVANPRLS